MGLLGNMIAGLRALTNRDRVERELDEELSGFMRASAEEKRRDGMTCEEAMRAARVEMGSANAVKHQIWSARWESTLEGLMQDTRLSVRMLAKSPGFTLVALLSLGLGIGGNTAIFTLMNQVLLEDLPVREPKQLVTFGKSDGGGVLGGIDLGLNGMFPWAFARQLQDAPGPFQGIAAFCSFSQKASVRPPGEGGVSPAVLVPVNLVSGNYFSVLGAAPLLGRAIGLADDATPGSGAVTVVSYRFWRQQLNADPAIPGKTITINGTSFTVIGVMPENFHGIRMELEPTALWAPVSMQAAVMKQGSFLTHDGPYFLHLFGRMSAQAAASKTGLATSQSWLDQQVRSAIRANEGASLTPSRQQEINRISVPLLPAAQGVSSLRNQYGNSLQILMGVVALVLLIACANLANFLLARATARQREISTRLALGSSRARIVRQSLIETLLLSLAGGMLGLGIAFGVTRALIAFVGHGETNVALSSRPDIRVLLFTFAVSLLTGVLFGLAPALMAARIGAVNTLSASARTSQSSGGRTAHFWPKALVTIQVMLSLVLLVGAGLFLRTLRNLQNQDFGFERTHLLLADFNPQLAGYKPSQVPGLNQQLIERLSALPGVRSAALSATPPIGTSLWTSTIEFSGYTPAPKEDIGSALNRVSGLYFETAGIPMVAGRAIGPSDTANSQKVAVINQAIARHFFPHGDALGRLLTIDIDTVKGPWQIVGIVRDTKMTDPRNPDPIRMAYIPLAQIEPFVPVDTSVQPGAAAAPREENQDRFANTILVRTSGDPGKSVADLRAAVAAVDPNLALLQVVTINDQVSNLMTHDELISSLTSIFSLLALLLAAIGLYGVMSYNVVRRTNEIGIRIALGAQTGMVQWMVLRESLLLLAMGVALGMPLAYAATRYIKDLLFGLNPVDPASFAIALVVVSGMTVFAGWFPARRATRVDPMVALRCD